MSTLTNICKSFPTRSGPRQVLNNICMEIQAGERVGILGRNGSGKSTLIKIIGGAEAATSGSIERKMRVSWPLGLAGGFQGSLTGYDNIRFLCRIYGVSIEKSIDYIKEFTQLGHYLGEPVNSYSSGMMARLAFATSFIVDFDCYLVDETLSVGDARFQELCRYEIQDKRKHCSMVLVSHLPQHIEIFCTTVYVLDEGKMKRFDNAREALDFYATLQATGPMELR